MDFYDGMSKKIDTKRNECEKKRESVLGQVEKFKKEIQELKAKQNDAVEKSDIDTFSKLDGEIKMREIILEKISADVDGQLKNNMVDMSEIIGLRDECRTYTNGQIRNKYKKIQEHILSIVAVLDEIDMLNQKYSEVCDKISYLGSDYSTYDSEIIEGHFYHMHRIPENINAMKCESIDSIRKRLEFMLESDVYV